ncbi:Uncharacterised protein [Mycobacterium tuberculosis]|nr:Uncharacterised protein [Mycobacterium tuberculosis]
MEVGLFGAHPAHVERQERLDSGKRGRPIVGDDHLRRRADLEVLAATPGAGPGESFVEPFVVHAGHAWRIEDGQPAIADLGGQRDVLGPLGPQHDWYVGAQRMGDGFERFAQTCRALPRQWQPVVRPGAGHRRFSGPHLAHDVDVFAGASQRLGKPLPVPTLDHLRTGHAEPENVPATGQMVQCQRGHRTGRWCARGQLDHRRTQPHPLRRRAPPGQRRVGVGPPRLGGEHRVKTRILGRGDEFRMVLRRLRAPIPQL